MARTRGLDCNEVVELITDYLEGTLDPGTAERLNETRARGDRIVAVGTTVVRTLEQVAVG